MIWRGMAVALALLFLPGLVQGKDEAPSHTHGAAAGSLDVDRPAPLSGASIYQARSEWKDMDARPTRLRSLRGRPVALAMVYTSCTTACPLIVAHMKLVESALSPEARARVWFVLASFDTERDRPEVLKKFAAAHELDPARWRLYHGDRATVRELALLLGVRYKRTPSGDFDHSNVVTLLDREGVIRHQLVGLGRDPAESAGLLENLAR
jgi:protein SCO1/2